MSPTLHKILFHGADIIRLIPRTLMMGQLSEEPLEASNKYAKKWALSHARRNDMENNHKDVFKRFCHLSDPVIHSYLYKDKLKKRNRSTGYPIPVLGMIKTAEEIQGLTNVKPALQTRAQLGLRPKLVYAVKSTPPLQAAVEPVLEAALDHPALDAAFDPALEQAPELALEPFPVLELAHEPALEPALEQALTSALEPALEEALELALQPTLQPSLQTPMPFTILRPRNYFN